MFGRFLLDTHERLVVFVREMNKLLGNFLFEIKLWIEPLKRTERFLESF